MSITALDVPDAAQVLGAVEEAYRRIRALPDGTGTRWVFASKLLARKRPYLFPVRDRVVCSYLNGGRLSSSTHTIGHLSIDVQVFAYLMSDPDITAHLSNIRTSLEAEGKQLEPSDLRLLDVVLWTEGVKTYGRGAPSSDE